MILSDKDIQRRLMDTTIGISERQVLPTGASVNLRIAPKLLVYKKGLLDSRAKHETEMIDFSKDGYFDFEPGKFYLGATIEYLRIPDDLCGLLYGRSSLARLGMSLHFAGFFDPGFEGTATLEIQNIGNNVVRLYAGQEVCQMVYVKMTEASNESYRKKKTAKYNGQIDPTESKLFTE